MFVQCFCLYMGGVGRVKSCIWIQYIEPLIIDTPSKGHSRKNLSIKDTLEVP